MSRIYLPFDNYAECAKCFTLKRLTKQRHDVMEVLYMLSGRNHPTRGDHFMYNSPPKKVWQYCPLSLVEYGRALCDEYEARTGKQDPIRDRLDNREDWFRRRGGQMSRRTTPDFLKLDAMHNSHRAILARQDPDHYAKFGFERDPDDEKVFYWPVEEAKAQYEQGVRLESDEDSDEPNDDGNDDWNDDYCDCESCQAARDASIE